MNRQPRRTTLTRLMAGLAIPLALAMAAPVAAHNGPALTPETVDATIADGTSTNIAKTVHTPEIPQNPEICFLADTTASMGAALTNVQNNIGPIMATVAAGTAGTARFCAAQYRDVGDVPLFQIDQALTPNQALVNAAAGTWAAGGGGNDPEDQLHALTVMSGAGPGWSASPPATHVIVWFGDCPGNDPASGGETLATTIAALNAGFNGPKRVIAVSVNSGYAPCSPTFLNQTGQATTIAGATGGVFLAAATAADVANAILAGLSSLPVTVSMASDCFAATGGVVSTTFAPASQMVTSGTDAIFTETISVTAGPAQQGQTYNCRDWALLNGQPMTDANGAIIYELKTIRVPDTTPPVATCVESVNPHGNNIPPAGSTTLPGPKGGQNEDGFYLLTATDNVDPNPQIFVLDSGSGAIFGPYPSGTILKITQAPGVTPKSLPMAGVVTAHLLLNGDALVYAVDASGNVSARVSCLVPPPPK